MDSNCNLSCYRKKRSHQPSNIEKANTIQLIFFDMDGVITDTISSWKYIHDYFGTSNERSVNDYLEGNIDDLEFIKRDVSLWKENGKLTNIQKIENILSQIKLIKGAKECFTHLHKKRIPTAIVSAGLDILAQRVAKNLGIKYVFANGIKQDRNGNLTGDGILNVQLMYKDKNVRFLAQKLNIPLRNCAAVGNSCFDIPMFETCGIGIAFNPEDQCVREFADIVVEEKDLRQLFTVLKSYV